MIDPKMAIQLFVAALGWGIPIILSAIMFVLWCRRK